MDFHRSTGNKNLLWFNYLDGLVQMTPNRVKLPEVVKDKLKPSEIVRKENGDEIVIAKWRDKRDVTILSTRHSINMVDTEKNNEKKRKYC